MEHRYSHILSPVKVGNVVLRNRIFATKCISQELQGPENFPAESSIQYVEDLANNGAALVVVTVGSWPQDRGKSFFTSEFQMENFRVLRYFVQEVARVHAHNSLAIGGMMCSLPTNVEISEIRHPERIQKVMRSPLQTTHFQTEQRLRKALFRGFPQLFIQGKAPGAAQKPARSPAPGQKCDKVTEKPPESGILEPEHTKRKGGAIHVRHYH